MRGRLLCLSLLAVAGLSLALALARRQQVSVTLHTLDVGQGDAVLLRSGKVDVLVDGGPDATVVRRLGEVRPAWDRRLEVVVLTHPDLDHVGGLSAVFEREDVGLLLLPAIAADNLQFRSVLAAAAASGVPVRFARPGQQLRAGALTLTVLAPDRAALRLARKKPNNGSIVLRAHLAPANTWCLPRLSNTRCLQTRCVKDSHTGCVQRRVSVLLTGDIERAAEHLLVRRAGGLLDVDVLKVPHHGSKTSTSLRLLRASTPALAVVSVGAGNRYGHPHPAILRRLNGSRLLRTDERGTVSFRVGEGRVTLACAWRPCVAGVRPVP